MIDHAHITASRSIRQPAGERRTPLLSKFLRYYHQVDDAMEITEHKIKIYVRPLRFLCAGVRRFVSLSYTHTRAVDTRPVCVEICVVDGRMMLMRDSHLRLTIWRARVVERECVRKVSYGFYAFNQSNAELIYHSKRWIGDFMCFIEKNREVANQC